MVNEAGGWGFGEVGGLLEDGSDVGGPAVLGEVRGDRVQKDQLGLDELDQKEGVDSLATLANQVVFLNSLGLEETVLQGVLVTNLSITAGSLINSIADFILEELIPQVLLRLLCKIQFAFRDVDS